MRRLLIWLGMAPLLVLVNGCTMPSASPVCEPTSSRCRGNAVELCGSDGQWYEAHDCSEATPGDWVCGVVDDGLHACVRDEK